MHPLNRFRDGYDFPRLVAAHPPLARFVMRSPRDEDTIDFADPVAVLTLNQALLKETIGNISRVWGRQNQRYPTLAAHPARRPQRACSTPTRSTASTCRSTTAITGRSSATACPTCR